MNRTVVEQIAQAGVGKLTLANTAPLRYLTRAALAGAFIFVGTLLSSLCAAWFYSDALPVAKLLGALSFSAALTLIVLLGGELFTGCNLVMGISLCEGKVSLPGALKIWVLSYLGNLVGASALAAGVVFSGQLDLSGGALAVSVIETAAAKCALSPGSAFLRGVLCNILVCVGVMCALCAKDVPGRAVGAFCPVCFFVVCGFEHCIANLYYIPAGLFARHLPQYEALALEAGADLSALNLTGFLLGNLLPVTLGNLLGGCAFAALMWYGHKKDYSSPV